MSLFHWLILVIISMSVLEACKHHLEILVRQRWKRDMDLVVALSSACSWLLFLLDGRDSGGSSPMMPASSPNIVEEVVIIASSPLRDRENALDVTSGNIYDFRCVLCIVSTIIIIIIARSSGHQTLIMKWHNSKFLNFLRLWFSTWKQFTTTGTEPNVIWFSTATTIWAIGNCNKTIVWNDNIIILLATIIDTWNCTATKYRLWGELANWSRKGMIVFIFS